MLNIKKIILALLFFVLLPLITVVQAAGLKFDKTTVSGTNGGTFQIAVTVDPGSDPILGTDAYVTFDSSLLKANSVSAGTLFPVVTNDTATSGRVYITGMVSDTATPVTTSGTLATITFQGLKEGAGTLAFDCNLSKIIKNDDNTSNVLVCSQNNSSAVTIGSGGGGGNNPTAPPDGNNNDGGGNDSGSNTPAELPQSGVFENVSNIAIPGIILLLLGGVLKLVL